MKGSVLGGQLDLLSLLDESSEPRRELVVVPPVVVGRSGTRTGLRAAWERTVARWPDGSPVTWTAPWDCGDGTPKGTIRPAVRCPYCRQIECNESLLDLNHGVALDRCETWQGTGGNAWTTCARQQLTESQADGARERGLAVHRCARCRCWTDETSVGRAPHPYECSGESAGHDWRAVS